MELNPNVDLHCKTCTFLSCGKCHATSHEAYVHILPTCPLNKWVSHTPDTRKKILWITQDFAQGGITSYIHYTVPYLAKSNTPVLAVIYTHDIKFDVHRAEQVSKYCPIYKAGSEPDSLYTNADIITFSYVYETEIIDYYKNKLNRKRYDALIPQAHGECIYTLQSVINQKHLITNCILTHKFGLAPTPYSQQMIRNIGVPDVRTLYYGMNQLDYPIKATRPFYRQSHPLYSPEPIRFLCAGRLDPHKQYDISAKLVDEFRKSNTYPPFANATLTLIGDGWARDQVISSLKPYPFVKHIPWIETDDLINQLHSHDVFLIHSKSEGGPIITLEALSCGVPVHSTPTGVVNTLSSLDPQRLLFSANMEPLTDFVWRLNSVESLTKRYPIISAIKKLYSPKSIDFSIRVAK